MDLLPMLIVLMISCLVTTHAHHHQDPHRRSSSARNQCEEKCKVCQKLDRNAVPILGQCVMSCVHWVNSGNDVSGFGCINECIGEAGGNKCDGKTTNCVDSVEGFYYACECKEEFPKRVDDISCEAAEVCTDQDPLGMENGDIPDANIQSSGCFPFFKDTDARLNNGNYAWLKNLDVVWIQADIGYATGVTGLKTQGGWGWFVKLKVSTFLESDLSDEVFIVDSAGDQMIFDANTNRDDVVTILFEQAVEARVVRIYGQEKDTDWDIRFEILGCKKP